MKNYNLIIIGGGPIGIACGLEAKKRGISYLIIEKGTIVNSLYHYPDGMTFFSSSERLEIDDIPFISKNAKPYKSEALEYYRRIVLAKELNIHLFENVLNIKPVLKDYEIETSKGIYMAKNVVIATGFYDIANLLNVPGENLPKVSHYYKNPHFYAKQKVVVVGSSNSSVDAALEIFRKGGEVTMVIRGKEIGKRVKYWVRPDIMNRIEEGSIKVYYDSEIESISENKVIVNQLETQITLQNDYVLALTGYRPDFKFLQEIGIQLSSDGKIKPIYNPETMETNHKNIYLAGVICGGLETHKWFIENSIIHAELIMNSIKGKI